MWISSFLTFVSAHWKELLSGMLQFFLCMKYGVWRAGNSIYNLKWKCYCFASCVFSCMVAKCMQDILLPLPQTNLVFSALSYWTVRKRANPSLCLMTVSDELAVRIQDSHAASCTTQLSCSTACPPQPVGSSAARWARDSGYLPSDFTTLLHWLFTLTL